ncbi:MAG: DUF2851 family protein [Bacteroidales bacterium]|nr:DUF2851 family protein [Bacteroidales bacterium]
MEKEDFFQFIWKQKLYYKEQLRTTCGKRVEIFRAGDQNFHAGPDFFNARIRIDQMVWAGNVEVHMHASDWLKHGHHLDPAYNNVILHVVKVYDGDIRNSLGRRIHTLVVDYPDYLVTRYDCLREGDTWLPCRHFIRRVPSIHLQRWLTSLQTERLKLKTGRISEILSKNGMGWEETFYLALASGYGLPINSLPFEMVASGIPLHLLLEYRDSVADLEAILFGQAGFLNPGMQHGPYTSDLLERHREKQASFTGGPVPQYLWRFLRLRPASFPTLRISQFAGLVHLRFPMMDTILSSISIVELEQLLRVRASDYWNNHYVFGKYAPASVKHMGQQSILTLIINVIVPFLFTFGRLEHKTSCIYSAARILTQLDAESNHIINKWADFGIRPNNAFESQALIQLYNAYCKQKRCLDCQIGAGFIEATVHKE